MKAIILAGGLGERLRPLTLETPKPLLPIQGKPIVQRTIENLKKHGITDIILSIGYKADQIKNYFGNGESLGVNISYNIEESPLGTGGAVKEIVKKFNIKEDFILVWADNLTNVHISNLIEEHKKNQGLITMTLCEREDTENFGVAKLQNNQILGFIEKPKREEAPSNLINSGVFVVHPSILDILPEGKSNIERECFEKIVSSGKMFGFKHQGYWFPTDRLELYQFAEQNLKED
jgi:mannose-1-phosphate guanylyltransferase